MRKRVLSPVSRFASKHRVLSTMILAVGALAAVVEPAAARISLNHNETLVDDAA